MSQEQLRQHLSNPNVQAFLGLLRDTEGTSKGVDPYRVYGGSAKKQLDDLSKVPSFTKWGFNQTDGKKNTSSATGAYQFLGRTWNNLAKQYGFKDFEPETQDMAAVALLIQNGALPHILKGDFDTAVKKSNKTWASLPGSPYAQHTRSNEYVQKSLAKHLGQPVPQYDKKQEDNSPKTTPPVTKSISPTLADNKAKAKTTSLWQRITNLLSRKR